MRRGGAWALSHLYTPEIARFFHMYFVSSEVSSFTFLALKKHEKKQR